MGSRIRFTKAIQVFETFPELAETVRPATGHVTAQEYTRELARGENPVTAIPFFAHALPKPEAVWWGMKCVEGLDRTKSAADLDLLKLSEAWVREGDEDARLAVYHAAEDSMGDSASLWIGRAASWSGGSLSPNPEYRVDAPPDLTAKAVNAAVQITVAAYDPPERQAALEACLTAGLSFAEGGVMPVVTLQPQAQI